MPYKHEEEVKSVVYGYARYSADDTVIDEVDEVYKKSKAWETLKEEMLTEYPYLIRGWETTHGEGEHTEMCKVREILERMDELGDTHEFRNLLEEMESE